MMREEAMREVVLVKHTPRQTSLQRDITSGSGVTVTVVLAAPRPFHTCSGGERGAAEWVGRKCGSESVSGG